MTNKEFLLTLTNEQCYIVLDWLLHKWGMQWTSTRDAVILWLGEEYKPEDFERIKEVWHLNIQE